MKVLVTGSAGFVGSHVVDYLLAKTDYEIVGLDSFRHRGDSLRIPTEHKDRYQMYTCDLAAPISLRLMEKIGYVDYFLNIASDSHVDRSLTDPVPFVQNNVNLSLSMLEYARLVKPRSFIQMSTDEVYGPAHENQFHAEWSPILPSNPYSASKACQEAISFAYWRSYDVPVIITNTMNVFGPRQDKEKFIPMLISKISKGETVTIHGGENGIGQRHYIHAQSVADALFFVMKEVTAAPYTESTRMNIGGRDINFFGNARHPRLNIVGEVELDNLQVAKAVAHILSKPLHYELVDFHKARPGHDRRYALDGAKMASFGWKPPQTFMQSLEQTIEWTLRNKEWL